VRQGRSGLRSGTGTSARRSRLNNSALKAATVESSHTHRNAQDGAASAAEPVSTVSVVSAADGVASGTRRDDRVGRGRLSTLLEDNPFPLVLVCATGVVLLAAFAPALLVGDSWLTLMAGREVVREGLPDTETLTVLGQGATWTDQQWAAQVVFYAADRVGGVAAVVLLDIALVLLALALAVAASRSGGATARSTFLVGLLATIAGPWGWTVRAQTTALPFFVGTLWLLLDASRHGARRRTLLVLPLLAVWANLHGSVVLGAGLAVALALVELVRTRGRRPAVPVVLAVAAPLCVLASPYAARLPAYYHLMLVDAPFADILREWQWSRPAPTTALFYALAGLVVVLVALPRSRSRLRAFELIVLAVTLISAVQAIRGVIWFSLACLAILPVALDGVLRRRDVHAPRLNRAISVAALTALAAAFLATAVARPTSWYLSSWPEEEVAAVAQATADPSTRVFGTDRHSDWLLWRIPALRGRIAFDVRFELYDRETLEEIVRYNGELDSDWMAIADGYEVIVLDLETGGPSHLDDFLAEPGTTIAFRDERMVVLTRR
jgi:hypothetical protein